MKDRRRQNAWLSANIGPKVQITNQGYQIKQVQKF